MFTSALILFTSWILFGLFIFGLLGLNLLLVVGWLGGLGFLWWFSVKIKDMEKKEIRRFIFGFSMVLGVVAYVFYNN